MHLFQGKDVLVKARTGSGKTLVYVLPILNQFFQKSSSRATGDRTTTVLVLLPTSELCQQVNSVFETYSDNIVRTSVFTAKGRHAGTVDRSIFNCDILITTPKSLLSIELLLTDILKNVKTVVFDEADSLVAGEGRGFSPY